MEDGKSGIKLGDQNKRRLSLKKDLKGNRDTRPFLLISPNIPAQLDVLIARLQAHAQMHERRPPPGQSPRHKGHTRESQSGIHKRPVLAQILQVLFVRRRLHVARALVLAPLRLLAEVDQNDGDQAQ